MKVFPGNYEDYLWRKQGGGQPPPEIGEPEPAAGPAQAAETPAKAAGDRRLNPIKLQRMRERQGGIEVEVEKLEAEIADYEAALGNFVSVEETRRVTNLLEERRGELKALIEEWEDVGRQIEDNS